MLFISWTTSVIGNSSFLKLHFNKHDSFAFSIWPVQIEFSLRRISRSSTPTRQNCVGDMCSIFHYCGVSRYTSNETQRSLPGLSADVWVCSTRYTQSETEKVTCDFRFSAKPSPKYWTANKNKIELPSPRESRTRASSGVTSGHASRPQGKMGVFIKPYLTARNVCWP